MKFIKSFKYKISKDFAYTLLGNIFYAGINFISLALIARFLGPYQFGDFSLLYAILSMIVIIIDFGMGVSVVKFSSEFYSQKKFEEFRGLFSISFKIKLYISILVFIIGIVSSQLISTVILNNANLTIPLILVFIGGIGLSLFDFMKLYFQSKQEFGKYSLYLIISASLQFILIILISNFFFLNLLNSIFIFCLIPFILFFVMLVLIDKSIIFSNVKAQNYKKILNFNIYIIISSLCAMLYNRIDLFFLNSLLSNNSVGLYSAAYQTAIMITLLTNSISFILLPKISSLLKPKEIRDAYKNILKYFSLVYLIIIPIAFITPFLMIFLYGIEYSQSISIFQILIFSIGLSIIINPLSILIYKVNKPYIITITLLCEIIFIILFEPLFIHLFYEYGVVYINIITHVIALTVNIAYLYYRLYINDSDLEESLKLI